MSLDETRTTIERYFDSMGGDEDFSRFFTGDVTWTMVDTGQEVRGPYSVRDYILELHGKMFDAEARDLVLSDGHAYLEGDGADALGGSRPRLHYCLVYDVDDGRITAMRCYGTLAALMAPGSPEARA